MWSKSSTWHVYARVVNMLALTWCVTLITTVTCIQFIHNADSTTQIHIHHSLTWQESIILLVYYVYLESVHGKLNPIVNKLTFLDQSMGLGMVTETLPYSNKIDRILQRHFAKTLTLACGCLWIWRQSCGTSKMFFKTISHFFYFMDIKLPD